VRASVSAKALSVAAFSKAVGRRIAYVSLAGSDLDQLEGDIRFFKRAQLGEDSSDDDVLVLPAIEADPYSGTSPHAEILERRALTLWKLSQGLGKIVLMSAGSLLPRVVGTAEIRQSGVRLRTHEEVPLDYLIDHLTSVGYVRSDPVAGIGEFSSRGGILDFFPPSPGDHPYRVEFFGDGIDSIRAFDPESQRSVARVDEAVIAPCATGEQSSGLPRMGSSRHRSWATSVIRARDGLPAEDGEPFPGWEHLMPLIHPPAQF
jgi:transcription-repair coupling factor (superfamily II helicase)